MPFSAIPPFGKTGNEAGMNMERPCGTEFFDSRTNLFHIVPYCLSGQVVKDLWGGSRLGLKSIQELR